MIKILLTLVLLTSFSFANYPYVKKYINDTNCDIILNNSGYFDVCYDYGFKSLIYGYTKLYKDKISFKNIKKRPRFYSDMNIPTKYRTHYSDYTHSGFNRGHAIANDASFDWSKKSLNSTYVMSNIVPQYPKTNQKSYLKVEEYSRFVTNKLGTLNILLKSNFSSKIKTIGRSNIRVADSFTFKLWNKDKNFLKCFLVPNDNVIYDLKDMIVDCQ